MIHQSTKRRMRMAAWPGRLCLPLMLAAALVQAPARAVTFDAYFGWNYVGGSADFTTLIPVLELTSFTYSGGTGISTAAVPAFPGSTGMPDGVGFVSAPTFTTLPAGDGETTRTIGATLPIDWGATAAPFLDILIKDFTFDVAGAGPFTASFGPVAVGWAWVGLVPVGAGDELCSTLLGPQGDIYDMLACAPGNPVMAATVTAAPAPFALVVGSTINVTFAAGAVPVPAAAWLFASALGLLGWYRLRTG